MRDPGYYFPDSKVPHMGFSNDSIFIAEQYQYNCRPEKISYATYKKEMKVPYVTPYKSFYTSSGAKYDMFVFV